MMKSGAIVVLTILLSSCGGGSGGHSAPNNAAPTITPIAAQSVIEGEVLSINAIAADSDGSIQTYHWQQLSGVTVVLNNDTQANVSVTAPAVSMDSDIVLRVSVTDNAGATAQTTVLITVLNSVYSSPPHRVNFVSDQDLSAFFAFFDHRQLPRIDITISVDEWQAFIAELQRDLQSDRYFKAAVTITSAGSSVTVTDTGFRLRGNTTRRIPEQDGQFYSVHFKLRFNETFDLAPNTLPYLERDERRYAQMRALNLKSRRPGYDDSQMRELYAYDLLNQIGLKASLATTVQLYLIIGERRINYGLYTAIEPVDKSFLRKRFGDVDNEGNLYRCLWQSGGPATLSPKHPSVADANWIGVGDQLIQTPSYDLKTNEAHPDHGALINLITQLDQLNGDALKTWLDANVDVTSLLNYLAMNMLVGMPDDYRAMGNNYYLYFTPDNRITFIPYDYDSAFGSGWHPFDTATVGIYDWPSLSGSLSGDAWYDAHPLSDKLLQIPAYRQRYEQLLRQFVADAPLGNFSFALYSAKFAQLKALYDPDGDDRIVSDVVDAVPWMHNEQQDYFEQKVASIRQQVGTP